MQTMISTYVNGIDEAVELYQKAFDAKLGHTIPSEAEDCKYYHAELDIYGLDLAIAEAKYALEFYDSPTEAGVKVFSQTERIAGNTMQICIKYNKGDGDKVRHAYEVLRDGSIAFVEIGAALGSTCVVDFVDKFGIRWFLIESVE